MNRWTRVFLFALSWPAAASAADVAGPAAPVPFSWSGFYIGANAGYGSARGTSTLTGLTGPVAGFVGSASTSDIGGALAGGQAGVNWQTGALVLGLEGDYQWAGLSRTMGFGCGPGCAITEKVGLTSFGTVRGRIGAAFDRVLVYATAGGAWMTARDEATLTFGGLTGQLGHLDLSGFGWTAGGGVEAPIADGWSIKGEYLYLSSSRLSGSGPVTALGTVRLDVDAHAHIARAGINRRF